MAGGWRRLLEEESEHQWLTLSFFIVFVVIGALAINATEHFVGDRVTEPDGMLKDAFVTEIEYGANSGDYTALVYSSTGGHQMLQNSGNSDNTALVLSQEDAEKVNFLKTTENGEVYFSIVENQLISVDAVGVLTYNNFTNTKGNFTVLDAASSGGTTAFSGLMLTGENTNTSFRGVHNGIPTHPMSTSSGTHWTHLAWFSDGLWVAIGLEASAVGEDGSSPATPKSNPVLGWIAWDGGQDTPELKSSVIDFDAGVFHSFARAGGHLIVGGTVESLIVSSEREIERLDLPSALVVGDKEGTAWFIGPIGAENLATYSNGQTTVHQLSRPIPVDVVDAGAVDSHVHVHGTDAEGQPIQWSIDITMDGSIESGRGFLNLLFLLVGSILIAMMLWHAAEQLRGSN
tara:strand:+ start:1429 stop:2634 length:1206 start_codon:yes stop_codon:yes gene_type:complete